MPSTGMKRKMMMIDDSHGASVSDSGPTASKVQKYSNHFSIKDSVS